MAAKMPGLSQTIKLEGEAEYRAKLKEISAGLRVLDSEMDKTRASFEGQEKSVEALSATQDVLSRKLSTQHERVETLRAALQQSAQTYGEADARTMSWQTQLNKAEAEELRLQHQIEGSTQEMRGFGDAVGDAASKLGINLPQGATNALNGLGSVSAGAATALAGFAALAAGIAKVEQALIDMTRQSAASADELETLSLKTGLTTQSLQELQYAAEFIDVDLNTITGSLAKLTRSMDSARDGSGAAAESFAKLGISVTNSDGSLRSAEDVFYEAIDALGQVQGATERDAIAMDLFGRSAQDLNPLIVQGSDALKDLSKEANATGYVLDDFAVKKLTAVDDGFKKLETSRETFTKKLSVEFAPATEKALGDLADFIDDVGAAIENSGAVDAFGAILEASSGLLKPLGELTKSTLPSLTPLLRGVALTVAAIASSIELIAAVLDVKSWGTGKIKSALGWDYYGAPNTYQRTVTALDKGWTFNDETGSWSNPNEVSYNDLYAQYQDWIRAGNGGTYEYWHDAVWEPPWGGSARSSGSSAAVASAPVQPSEAQLRQEFNKYIAQQLSLYGVVADDFSSWKARMGYNAAGTDNWRGGLTWVGENGPELALLPRGTQITSASESRELGGDTFNIYVDAKNIRELNDLVRIAQNARMNARKAVS